MPFGQQRRDPSALDRTVSAGAGRHSPAGHRFDGPWSSDSVLSLRPDRPARVPMPAACIARRWVNTPNPVPTTTGPMRRVSVSHSCSAFGRPPELVKLH